MSRIKKVTIDNFRNIKHLEFDLTDSTIISGENELGKSNALNSIVWFFTDTIYTDNSGVGENDINSIVPKDAVKGEYTSVSVEFTDGPTFTKVYKTGYDRITGKPNKHTTEGSINNVACKNIGEFNSKLMEVMNFRQCFTSVKELNLFIDPLYALQKLDAKALRTLLVSFGCTATNEEMYKLGFDDLRQYEKKYLGDFVNMRLDLKKQDKAAVESAKKYEILLGQYNSAEPFDDSKLNAINDKLDDLQAEKAKLMNGGNDETIKNFSYKLKELKLKLNAERDKKVSELNLKIKEIEGQKDLLLAEMDSARNSEAQEAKAEVSRLQAEIKSAQMSKGIYERSLETLRSQLRATKANVENIKNKKSDYQSKLVAESQRAFTGFIVCPCCGNSFAPDEEAEKKFIASKKANIQFYTEQIAQFNEDISKAYKNCEETVAEGKKTAEEIALLEKQITENKEWLDKNEHIVDDIMNAPRDMTRIHEMDDKVNELLAQISAVPSVDNNPQVLSIESKLEELKTSGQVAIAESLNDVNARIDAAENERENLYIERSNWKQKLEHQANYDKAIAQVNDIESLIQRVNDYIHAMIKLINDKAKAKTGMDFVMLEENLGNDGVKEVCYAVVDGVPFSMVNTAKKYECGIHFIEKVKDIAVKDFSLPRNDLPILADKFEGIDHIEKIKDMTKEQIICTRVGLEKEITIL